MGIRTACFAAAIFVQEGWARLLCVVLAAVLPIFAVLVANAGGDPKRVDAEYIDPEGLPGGTQPADTASAPEAGQHSSSHASNSRSGADR